MKAMAKVRALSAVIAITGVACASTGNSSATSQPERTSQASSQAPSSPTTINESAPGTIPAGQEVDVRLRSTLSSETAQVEQRFETTTVVDLMQNGRVLVPAGSVMRGVVSDVDKAGRVDRDGALTLTFDRLSVNGRERDIRGSATQIFESKGIREEGTVAAAGAGVGGIVGGIIGGVKGAVLGAVIGAGGAIAATDGKDITLPAGSIVRVRLDSPVRVG
ncbi:MAG TPA: hypothetical protein VFB92_07465 [Vicinamibacterales bacterium]|jgi:hypothetical protein|nr:hypothetical protein [Vicinamibacterales bacterium]